MLCCKLCTNVKTNFSATLISALSSSNEPYGHHIFSHDFHQIVLIAGFCINTHELFTPYLSKLSTIAIIAESIALFGSAKTLLAAFPRATSTYSPIPAPTESHATSSERTFSICINRLHNHQLFTSK
ncbi:CinA-like protein [Listeria monocytogenes]|nr:CinA-like protein [Listeria monocytogenes]